MFRDKKIVIIARQQNLLHYGLSLLVEDICSKRNLTVVYAQDEDGLCITPGNNLGEYKLAILCLSCDVYFSRWFRLLLNALEITNGNLLIFKDAKEILNHKRKSILSRVCSLESILNSSMPLSYISNTIESYLDRNESFLRFSRVTSREISVLEGYLAGIDAACHSSRLGIDIKTLYQHRKNCANKLGVRNLKDLLRL